MSKPNGGYAFPRPASVAPRVADVQPQDGMTLRDYFAGMALQGMLAASENLTTDELALYAYDVADAMLKAREK